MLAVKEIREERIVTESSCILHHCVYGSFPYGPLDRHGASIENVLEDNPKKTKLVLYGFECSMYLSFNGAGWPVVGVRCWAIWRQWGGLIF